ncbi:hypothetical protein SAMN05421493_11157 [Pseudobutyrivibrio sp. 49]|uniref:alpha/beta fold hydrolase n=1 Tax=Pseudobutyrivibrio sp. 49 TaxID=1855344 RepID=UPI0008824030|nr:2-hydroxy-6-oxo-6-phenylhexa-2,4-dienoate hydrolase [Pseudobutyrivibrio sp. 49]SDI30521.1 hypothetical protein SAMN05421493_11157 [Pseudobutyrivibrio sp. 49]
MQFEEIGNMSGKTLMLLPGTCCDWQTNFGTVISELAEKYHLICVNYDGFDGSDDIFPDMITVTEKIENYIRENHYGRLDGAIGSSLGSSFVGQLVQRRNIHIDHAIFGSPDLDQSGKVAAKLQSLLVVPLLTSFTKSEKKRNKTKEKLKSFFLMNDETAEKFINCFSKFSPESIKNEYYTDLLTYLEDDIEVEHTRAHFIYANKMGEKYLKRYKKYFHNPDIREFDMQHEQWLFGEKEYSEPVLRAIDEFMNMAV